MRILRFSAPACALWLPLLCLGQTASTPAEWVRRSGPYEITLRLPPDGLFAQEEMQVEFRVADTSRPDPVSGAAPVIRAKITGRTDMPSMPGMLAWEEIAHPEGVAGDYGLHPTFAHGGEFRIRLNITPPGVSPFEVEYRVQVADAPDARRRKPGMKPYSVELRSEPRTPKAGEPAHLTLTVIRNPSPLAQPGTIVTGPVRDFEKVHDAPMHLILVRSDLGTFDHLHPEWGRDGTFQIRHTFASGGTYQVFADVAPRGAGSQVLLTTLKVNGSAKDRYDLARATAKMESVVNQTRVSLSAAAIPAGKTITVTARVTGMDGQAARDLKPYYGALGHLILIHQDATTYVHSHPDERDPKVFEEGVVPFLVRFPKPGRYRGWAQFQRGNDVITADFLLEAGQ
jgi:hypothetical protein